MMTFTAKQFQNVIDIAHKWYLKSFRDLLVNGQLALPCDFQRDEVLYILKCCAKLDLMYYRARQEEQCGGAANRYNLVLPSLHQL